MSSQDSTLVQIYNHQYNVASDDDSAGVERVASYLDEKMREASKSSGKTAPLEVAVMAAMEIAQEVLIARVEKEALLDQADERISSFTKRLERGTRTGTPPESAAEDDSSDATEDDSSIEGSRRF